MDELIRRLEQFGTGISNEPVEGVEVSSLKDPESLSEVNMRFYFRSGEVHYIFSVERPDMDGVMLEHNLDDFYRMFFFGGLSPEQQRTLENSGISQRIIRINQETHTIDVLTMDSYREHKRKKAVLEAGNVPVVFSAARWTYEKNPWCLDPSYENIADKRLDSILDAYRNFEEIDAKEVLADVLPKLRKAAMVYRERLAAFQNNSF